MMMRTKNACCIRGAPKRNRQGQAAEGAKMERSQMAAAPEPPKMEATEGAILERFGRLQGKG
jgi:hypothetical protein